MRFSVAPSTSSTRFLCAALTLLAACSDAGAPTEVRHPEDPMHPPETRVIGLNLFFTSTCALTEDGKLHCWGENRFGEFGDGTYEGSSDPVPAAGGLTFDLVAGSVGTPQACGIARDGLSYCWGYNVSGELGDGTTTTRLSPTRIASDVSFRSFATSYHTCGLSTNGTAYCWGSGIGGQLGTGDEMQQLRPAPVKTDERFETITNGMQFSCALTAVGKALCWGWGVGLGSGDGDRSVPQPTPVSGDLEFRSISAGEEHVCAVASGGVVYCWGNIGEVWGETYHGTPTLIPSPVPIVSVTSASRMLVNGTSCGLTAEGDAYCWHSGLEAQPVPGGYRFAGIAGGNGRFCGYTPGGSALCWHWSVKAVADTTKVELTTPEPVPSLAARD